MADDRQQFKSNKVVAVLLRIMQNAAQHRDHDHHREYRFYRGMYKPHVLHRKARPAAPVSKPCTMTCPARIVRKIAHKYPIVPRIIAAIII